MFTLNLFKGADCFHILTEFLFWCKAFPGTFLSRLNTEVDSSGFVDFRLRLSFLEPGVVRCRYVTQAVFLDLRELFQEE